jgi:hypothetical protein
MMMHDIVQNSALIIVSLYAIHACCKAYDYDPCISWHYSWNKRIDTAVGLLGLLLLLLVAVDCVMASAAHSQLLR